MRSFLAFHPFAAAITTALVVSLLMNSSLFKRKKAERSKKYSFKLLLTMSGTAVAGFLIAEMIVQSRAIALPFGLITSAFPYIYAKRRVEQLQIRMHVLWPEILDHVISGLQSGLSLAETLSDLSRRGPELSRPIFLKFQSELLRCGDFSKALASVKAAFADPVADQVCEVLLFSRGSGSRDTALTLRMLSDFVRSDLAVRSEITAKHGWIKNSAILAAIAPWILLIILASQPNTVRAYSSPAGISILLVGVALTVIAYVWMNYVGKLPEIPRVFPR